MIVRQENIRKSAISRNERLSVGMSVFCNVCETCVVILAVLMQEDTAPSTSSMVTGQPEMRAVSLSSYKYFTFQNWQF